MGPDALQHAPASVDPATRSGSGGSTPQPLSQNHITAAGNETKDNTPGGNANEVRHSRINKPRNSPNPAPQNAK